MKKRKDLKSLFESVYQEFSNNLQEVDTTTVKDYIEAALKRGPVGIAEKIAWGKIPDKKFDIIVDKLIDVYRTSSGSEKQNALATLQNAYYPAEGTRSYFKLNLKDDAGDVYGDFIDSGKFEKVLSTAEGNIAGYLMQSIKNHVKDFLRKKTKEKSKYFRIDQTGSSEDGDRKFDLPDAKDELTPEEERNARILDEKGLTMKDFANAAIEVFDKTKEAVETGIIKNPKIGIAFSETLLGKNPNEIYEKYSDTFNDVMDVNATLGNIKKGESRQISKFFNFINPIFSKFGFTADVFIGSEWKWLRDAINGKEGVQKRTSGKLPSGHYYADPKDYGATDYDELYANLEEEDVQAIMEAVIRRIKKELL
jgi:hypothetical protein